MAAAEYYAPTAIPSQPFIPPSHPNANPLPPTPPLTGSFTSPTSVPKPQHSIYSGSIEPTAIPTTRTPSPATVIHRPYSRPTSRPTYSPYNPSRPKPRKGFLRRIRRRLISFFRELFKVAREHPLRTAILGILPVGVVSVGKQIYEGGMRWLESQAKGKGDYGGVLDEFVGFGGSRQGPLDGVLKLVQMFVNHCCKLTPHAAPRIISMLLEIYFLKDMVLQVASNQE